MKKVILAINLLVMAIAYPVTAEFQMPDYQKLTLNNGLTVYLMEQHEVPLIDILMVTKAGAVNDGKNYGLATLTGNALSFGSGDLSKKEIEDLFAFHGANFSSRVAVESSSVSLSIASKDVDKLLPVFKDIILKPQFDKIEFAKEKKRYIDQLKQSREQPRNIINSAFNKLYYQQHLYGNPVEGDINSIQNIALKRIKDFYANFYSPNNSALVLVGDFKTGEMEKEISQLFSDWKPSQVAPVDLSGFKAPMQSNVWIINKEDAIETTFMIGGKGIPSNHPDRIAVQVINTILGGRFTSWLNDELRVNSGLTYGARSSFNSQSQEGNFVISTFTKKESTFETLNLALKTYQRIWNKGIDSETLESAKSYVKGQFPPHYETSTQLAQLLARVWSLNLDEGFINDFQKNVDSLNVKKANQIAKSLFPKDNLQYILIGKADELREKAKAYGKIKEMEIDSFTL